MLRNDINGYILAGGKSSRMGTDKGLMLLNGKPVVQQIIEQLQSAVEKIYIVSNKSDYGQFGFEVIPDQINNIGPAGGLHAALLHTDKALNFVVSCDMPFINTKGVNYILEKADQSTITLPRHGKSIEPLFGIYTKGCFTKWESLILSGEIKLQEMITYFDPKIVDVTENKYFEKDFFTNLNTMSDFENAQQFKL